MNIIFNENYLIYIILSILDKFIIYIGVKILKFSLGNFTILVSLMLIIIN